MCAWVVAAIAATTAGLSAPVCSCTVWMAWALLAIAITVRRLSSSRLPMPDGPGAGHRD